MSDLTYKLGLRDNLGVTGLGMLVWGLLGLLTVCVAIFCAVLFPSRAVGRTTCANWAAQTGVQTKFVLLNWADTGTCLARTPSGRWVKNSQWYSFVNGASK